MKRLYMLNIFNVIFAFLTSMVQTQRIITTVTKYNTRNSLLIGFLAMFAATPSVIQTKKIINESK